MMLAILLLLEVAVTPLVPGNRVEIIAIERQIALRVLKHRKIIISSGNSSF